MSDDLAGRVVEAASQLPGVASVTPPVFNENRELAVFVVTPTTAPQDEETSLLLSRLRGPPSLTRWETAAWRLS